MRLLNLIIGMSIALPPSLISAAEAQPVAGRGNEKIAMKGLGEGDSREGAVTPEDALVVPWTRFNIQYTVREMAGSKPRKVEFYITSDMGKTWRLYGEDPDVRSPMTVQVPGEGVYGFVSIGTDAGGSRDRPPIAGTRPEVVVIVDRTPPSAAWLAPQTDQIVGTDGVELAWESNDDHPASRPVSIEYSADSGKTWKTIKAGLPANGRFTWSPTGEKGALQLRLTVLDRAANTLRLLNRHRLLLDSTPPHVRITGPALSASDRFDVLYEAEDDAGGVGVGKVVVWYTTDDGRTWERGAEDVEVKGRIQLQISDAEQIGLYGQAVDKAGNAGPPPQAGMAPPFTLTIDSEKPKVRLDVGSLAAKSTINSGDKITVRWSATDTHLKENPVAIDLFDPIAKRWENLESNLPASGSWVWDVKRGLAGKDFLLRAVAVDSVGNVGEARSHPFQIRGAGGSTRISDVRAIDSDVGVPGKPDEEIVDDEEATVARPAPPRVSPPAAPSTAEKGGDKGVQSAKPATASREPTPPPLPPSLMGDTKEGSALDESSAIAHLPLARESGAKTDPTSTARTMFKPPTAPTKTGRQNPPQPPPPPSDEEWVESVAEKSHPPLSEKAEEPARKTEPLAQTTRKTEEEKPVTRVQPEPKPLPPAVAGDAKAKADALVREASEMFRNGQKAQAMSRCSEALHLNPAASAARLLLAQIYLADGKNAEAMAEAEKAANLRPTDAAAWRELGTAALSLAREIQDNEIAVRAGEEGPALARLAERRDMAMAKAREAFQQLLRLAPDQKDTYDRMGDVVYLQARCLPPAEAQRAAEMYREASEYYRKGMAIGRPTYRELFQIGVCALRVRQFDEAQRFLEQAVEAAAEEDENPREAFWYLADFLERQGKLREALRYWEKAAKAWESDERYREEAKKRAAQIKRTLGEP